MQRRGPLPTYFSRSVPGTKSPAGERGYVLLTLIFFVAVLAISLATILPSVVHEAKRDREEELVHRGAQYTRAIRLYFKKMGRYPATLEDLESTNNIRFLRKRYKDPMSKAQDSSEQGDFKVLRFGDPGVRLQQPGAAPLVPAQPGQAGTDNTVSTSGRRRGQGAAGHSMSDPPAPSDSTDSNQNSDAPAPAQDAGDNPPADASQAKTETTGGKSSDNPVHGGGAIVGVTSISEKDSIREFNKKHHYSEWQFIYDPTTDRGGLPSGPWQPQNFAGQPVGQPAAGQPGTPAGNQPAPNAIPQPVQSPVQ